MATGNCGKFPKLELVGLPHDSLPETTTTDAEAANVLMDANAYGMKDPSW